MKKIVILLMTILFSVHLTQGQNEKSQPDESESRHLQIQARNQPAFHSVGSKDPTYAYHTEPGKLVISYGYDGEFGRFEIADTAVARLDGVLVGKAKALRIIEKDPGPNSLEVEEEQFSQSGKVTYRGVLIFSLGNGNKLKEKRIAGRKVNEIFSTWAVGGMR